MKALVSWHYSDGGERASAVAAADFVVHVTDGGCVDVTNGNRFITWEEKFFVNHLF